MTIEVSNIDKVARQMGAKEDEVLKNVKRALLSSGNLIKKIITDSMQKEPKGGKIYTRGSVSHQASAPRQAPAVDTGRLVSSINVDFRPDRYYVDAGVLPVEVEYARYLEYGTRKMQPRPFIAPARVKARRPVERKFQRAVEKGVKDG